MAATVCEGAAAQSRVGSARSVCQPGRVAYKAGHPPTHRSTTKRVLLLLLLLCSCGAWLRLDPG